MSIFNGGGSSMNTKVWLSIGIVGLLSLYGVSQYRRSLSKNVPQPINEAISITTTQQEPFSTVAPIVTGAAVVRDIALTITTPTSGQIVTSDQLTVEGKTSPGADIFVNDAETKANAAGLFSVKLTLEEGENYILIVANDVNGNYAEKEITVTYTP